MPKGGLDGGTFSVGRKDGPGFPSFAGKLFKMGEASAAACPGNGRAAFSVPWPLLLCQALEAVSFEYPIAE